MIMIPRRVSRSHLTFERDSESPVRRLAAFRDTAAWVLLGEPGAGKTEALRAESEAVGGRYLRISEFIAEANLDNSSSSDVFFLDGLDETRASTSDDSVLLKAGTLLKRLGRPKFRIACRAADWIGSLDLAYIDTASPDGEISVLMLEPLSDGEILEILRVRYRLDNPENFVEGAASRGLVDLLKNPQMLDLLVTAVRAEQWPATRQETFQLACEKLLEESNPRIRRAATRNGTISKDALHDAAGHLCAAMLLADKQGVAVELGQASLNFPVLGDFIPPLPQAANRILNTRLFKPESDTRLVPIHRSVVEFLAARWLGQCVARDKLSLGRLLRLLQGRDGRVVAGLRGLYAWFASLCLMASKRLIANDPLTVVLYGDIEPLNADNKLAVLEGLRMEAHKYPFFAHDQFNVSAFGALADPALEGYFTKALSSPVRTDEDQAFVQHILNILGAGRALVNLADTVKSIVLDNTRWRTLNIQALEVWLHLDADDNVALALLEDIEQGNIDDVDDELTGVLLHYLYPRCLNANEVLRYLHLPKQANVTGTFKWFWGYELPRKAPDHHIPFLLDYLSSNKKNNFGKLQAHQFSRMSGELLVRGLNIFGESIDSNRLFEWLGTGSLGCDSYSIENSTRERIAEWLSIHPQQYLAVRELCFCLCATASSFTSCVFKNLQRLDGATAPDGLGRWHLELASKARGEVAHAHLVETLKTLFLGQGNQGLSLEMVEAWASGNPEREKQLQDLLYYEIPVWRLEQGNRAMRERDQDESEKQQRSIWLAEHLEEIQNGVADAHAMQQLAYVWDGRYYDIAGSDATERFEKYCYDGSTVLIAAERGFKACVVRSDLPSASEISELASRSREHLLRFPCLVGMRLRWSENPAATLALPEEVLRKMLAFRLTDGAGSPPDWFVQCAVVRPEVVSSVLIDYVSTALKAKSEYVDGIHLLAHDIVYRQVAVAVAPELLIRFPVRANSGQLRYLRSLLNTALKYHISGLGNIVKKKIGAKGMDLGQRIYWLTIGSLLDPTSYEDALWRAVAGSESRISHLSTFIKDEFAGFESGYKVSAALIGKMIEYITPYAQLDWPSRGGVVTEAMARGRQVETLIVRLSNLATESASIEIERLLGAEKLVSIRFLLERARHQLQQKRREIEFGFYPLRDVVRVLANGDPSNIADLTALVLDHLEDIGVEIRQANHDAFVLFWDEKDRRPTRPRDENRCRDVILGKMSERLSPMGVDCQPEGDYFNDKRADIRISYVAKLDLPIEIKREGNKGLWTALRNQLMAQYSIAPNAKGHGIYLVLWFGQHKLAPSIDGQKQPRSPAELQTRLEAQLNAEERDRIFVRVLDVSWPVALPKISSNSESHTNTPTF